VKKSHRRAAARDLSRPEDGSPIYCNRCKGPAQLPFSFGANSNIVFTGSSAQCMRCGNMIRIPDGTFRTNAAGLLSIVRTAPDPRAFAEELRRELQRAQESSTMEEVRANPRFAAASPWLPNSVQNVAAYIAILTFLLMWLSRGKDSKTEINQTFIQQYNEYVQQQPNRDELVELAPGDLAIVKARSGRQVPKIGRNDPCPCGAGKKYKKCHGAASGTLPPPE
jgi:hypothetical protein